MFSFMFNPAIIWLWLSLATVSVCEFSPILTSNTYDMPSNRITYFDDSTSVILVRNGKLFVSHNDGVDWEVLKVTEKENVDFFVMDPFNNDRAIAFNHKNIQFITNDKGLSWTKFEFDTNKEIKRMPVFKFNAEDKNYVIAEVFACDKGRCSIEHYYTTDGFKTKPKLLQTDAESCIFARSTKTFKELDKETIYCKMNKLNSFGHVVSSYVIKSSDFFKTFTEVSHSRRDSGSIIDLRVIETFMVISVQNDKFNKNSKISLLISKDGLDFSEAEIEVDSTRGMISFLESSPSSIVLSIQDFSTRDGRATLYMSDSSGLRFYKIFEDSIFGIPTKVETIDGVWIINLTRKKNETNIDDSFFDFKHKIDFEVFSKVSIDNGKTWRNLAVNNDPECSNPEVCSLHLFSTSEENGDNLFVTGPTPGILLGIGNKGKYLSQEFSSFKTWVSRDGGLSWDIAIDSPVIFSFADQGNIILGIDMSYSNDMTPSMKYFYSSDQGRTWDEGNLETPLIPSNLLTTIDGTSTKFILTGIIMEKNAEMPKEVIYTFDFGSIFNGKTCDKNDFEEFFPRTIPDKEPLCIFGHKEMFQRRKQDSKCLVNKLFEDIQVHDIQCDCTENDYECAPGFKLSSDNSCEPDRNQLFDICKLSNKKVIKLDDKILAEGNTCNPNSKSNKFIKSIQIKCSDYLSNDGKGDFNDRIITKYSTFDSKLAQYVYLEDENIQENIIVRTANDVVYASNNGGVSFVKLLIDDPVILILQGYISGQVVLITDKDIIYISNDSGNTFKKLKTPSKPAAIGPIISFHRTDKNKFIWYSTEKCEYADSKCNIVTYFTEDGGKEFHTLKKGAKYCEFVGETINQPDSNLIFCTYFDATSNRLQLTSSDNFFTNDKLLFEDIVGFALTGNFIFVATVENSSNLKAKVSLDGNTFADADFPVDFKVDHQQAYTVLGSESHAIFLHVTTNNDKNRELGSILKSNSNGTSYVQSLNNVNRNTIGYVDFDRIEGIEGLILSNTVENHDSKKEKKIKTQITHNDGAEWSYLVPPTIDSTGKKYSCIGQSLSKCSLNLHGFTERTDYRDTFSSNSAVGLMIGVGNVGEYLHTYDEAATFITRDGGITWKEIKKGVFMWEYGDGGTILILVSSEEETNKLSYSLDEGDSWIDYEFSKKPVKIIDLATVPSDTSRKFLIFATKDNKQVAFSIDFTDIYSRQCQLDLDHPENDDFEYWSPKHPNLPDNCLFGHETKFLRRASNHVDCFIGSAPLKEGLKVTRNCSCTRRDYECDYNYYRDSDDTCKLVNGLSPSDHRTESCKKKDAFEYFEPTGYRKIPLSTCEGGKEFDKWNAKPCPGKEKQFNQHYGKDIGGGKLLLLIGIPSIIFIFSVWFVYDRGIRRNGGFQRFGMIRLDDDDFQPIENNTVDKVVNKIIKGGIIIVASTFAVFKTIKKIDGVLIERVTSLFFRRQPGRRNYVQVPDFENEDDLFGENDALYDDDAQSATIPNTQFYDEVDESDVFESNDQNEPEEDLFNIDDQSDDENQESTDENQESINEVLEPGNDK